MSHSHRHILLQCNDHLEIHDDGLDQEEDGRVILPVDVGGGFAQLNTGDGSTLHQLLAATLASQSFP